MTDNHTIYQAKNRRASMKKFYNIPSATPISKSKAYREAVARFGVDRKNARLEHDGIVYQGDHGAEVYVEWKDLPAPTK
jgi:uncharacterized membrane protein YkoI